MPNKKSKGGQITPLDAVKKVKSNINKIARDRGASQSGPLFTDCRRMLKIIEDYVSMKQGEDDVKKDANTTGPEVTNYDPDSQDRGEQV